MSHRAPPPDETDLLCESCGYILNGLDPATLATAVCPECGEPLADSVLPGRRQPSPIEQSWSRRTFWQTTWRAIAAKKLFYRNLITRADSPAVARFGRIHRSVAGVLFALAATFHAIWMAEEWSVVWTWKTVGAITIIGVAFIAISVPLLSWLTRLATFLTTTESRFWGMRLPTRVVARAMNFHAANYLPIAVVALAVTAGYRVGILTGLISPAFGVRYLVTLCALVVISAIWLFESYVVAMRRIRLANF